MQGPCICNQRAELERFVAERYERAYGARLTRFLPHLLGFGDEPEGWQAAVGFADAEAGPLFLEQYLDAPVEEVLERVLGEPVPRARIVEVGNFAATGGGTARRVVPLFASFLRRLEFEIAVFTATRELRNTFRRLGLAPLELAPADPSRLPNGTDEWGTYYAHGPVVMAGRIADCRLRAQ